MLQIILQDPLSLEQVAEVLVELILLRQVLEVLVDQVVVALEVLLHQL